MCDSEKNIFVSIKILELRRPNVGSELKIILQIYIAKIVIFLCMFHYIQYYFFSNSQGNEVINGATVEPPFIAL